MTLERRRIDYRVLLGPIDSTVRRRRMRRRRANERVKLGASNHRTTMEDSAENERLAAKSKREGGDTG